MSPLQQHQPGLMPTETLRKGFESSRKGFYAILGPKVRNAPKFAEGKEMLTDMGSWAVLGRGLRARH